ncbi:glycosyltransferase family 4 protein [Actimicrobium sp. GrIS 1.19]|uniref:glycosyltransferase family 4 protein n=1 Tax=Actimicrobium sp. GrIS 1.19 TaxID=3071708 RepID=UPI002E13BFA2
MLGTLITELLRRGHHVSATTLSSDMPLVRNSTVTATGKNFSMTYCPMRPRAWQMNGWRPGRIVDLYRDERRSLQRAILAAAPDVVHAHWAYEFSLAAMATKIPHVVTCHDSPFAIAKMYSSSRPTISAYRWLRVLMGRKVLREAKCITAVSPYMRDEVQELASTPIEVVPNPVDALAFSLSRPRNAPSSARIVMVCNGWDVRKNPEPALLGFAEFRRDHPDAELHLFGHGFGANEIAQSWCVSRGIDGGMVFHGATSHHLLLNAIAAFDLLLHPSLEESFGMVIAEAMAIGLPVVAGQKSGAVPWVVGKCGTLCDVANPNAIRLALDAAFEPLRYQQISHEGVANSTERFSTTKVVDRFYSLYQDAQHNHAAKQKNSERLRWK